jgi:integrase
MRTTELENENRLARSREVGLKDSSPGPRPLAGFDLTTEGHEAYRKLFKHAGLVGHPHRFRHTFAKNLLLSGVPLETVSLLLGHKKLAITEKHYARFVPERQALIEDQVRKSWSRVGHTRKLPSK